MKSFPIVLGLLSIFLTVCRGAPPHPASGNVAINSWKALMDSSKGPNHGLQESVAVFTDPKVMPFTVPCYSEPCCEKPEQVLCPSYYELMIAVNASSNVSSFNITGIRDSVANPSETSPSEADEFCKNFANIFTNLNVSWSNEDLKEEIQHAVYCSSLCITRNGSSTLYVTPLCNAMTLMSAALQTAPPVTKSTLQQVIQGNMSDSAQPKLEQTELKTPDLKSEVKSEANNKASNTHSNDENPKKTTTTPSTRSSVDQNKPEANEKVIKDGKEKIESAPKASIVHPDKSDKQLPSKKPENPEAKVEPPKEVQQPVTNLQETDLDENKEDNNIPVKANEQLDDPNSDAYLDNTDDLQKSDQKNYSDEKDADDFNPPQADTQQTLKDPAMEEIIETKQHKIRTQTSDGVSANYLPASDPFYEESGSNFFTYFLVAMFACIILYVLYHNKTKVLALILEGRRGQKGRTGRRKHTAQYRKLDTNLEEAITSSASGRSSQIIY